MTRYQVMPSLQPEEYESLKKQILDWGGVRDALIYDQDGNLVDGHHRERAYKELIKEGHVIPEPPTVVLDHAPGLPEDLDDGAAMRTVARSTNMGTRNLKSVEKRDLVKDQLKDTPHLSAPWIARILGVGQTLVKSVRTDLESAGKIDYQQKLLREDGVWQARQGDTKATEETEKKAGDVKSPESTKQQETTSSKPEDATPPEPSQEEQAGGESPKSYGYPTSLTETSPW